MGNKPMGMEINKENGVYVLYVFYEDGHIDRQAFFKEEDARSYYVNMESLSYLKEEEKLKDLLITVNRAEMEELIEAGLNISNNPNEVEYIKLIAQKLNIDITDM